MFIVSTLMAARKSKAPKVRESVIQAAILSALRWRKDVEIWRSNTGAARLPGVGGKLRPVFFGVPGQGDITGVIKPWGVHLEIECKRPGEKQNDNQVSHEKRIRSAGGVYILATSAADCVSKLETIIAELRDKYGEAA